MSKRIEGKRIYFPAEELLCKKCGESLPATEEFFYAQKTTFGYTLNSPCIACIAEKRLDLAGGPCIEPGCTGTRASHRRPRCLEHERQYYARLKQRKATAS